MEYICILIFAYTNFMGLRKKVIQPRGYVRFGSNFLFRPSLVILKILRGQNFTKLDKGFRLVYKLLYLVVEKFWSIFAHKGGPLPKKSRNFDSQPDITIYTPIESPCRVYSKYFVFKNIYINFWSKKA
jgi:hypothetical protein